MNQWKNKDGKAPVVAVIGATGGIGRALCCQLAGHGVKLVIGARHEEPLMSFAREINAYALPVDAGDSGQVDEFFQRVIELQGSVDGAVCCTGSLLLKPAHLTSDKEWFSTLEANLTAAFFTLRAAVREMREAGGSVVLCSSAAARHGFANHEAISAAKGGIISLMLSGAATYAKNNIRVNCVAPGLTRTPLTKALTENETMAKASANLHALGRLGAPDDVANAISWLLDPAQSWITGQVIGIDGGLSSVHGR